MNMGDKIRNARKNKGISMKELANRVGVSYLTIQRVETSKLSPSAALLSDIAVSLNEPIINFFDNKGTFCIVRAGAGQKIDPVTSGFELLVPKGAIDEKISIAFGRLQASEYHNIHPHKGFEIIYFIKGDACVKYKGTEYEIKEGDLIYFDTSIERSVIAHNEHEFLSIFIRERS